MNAFITKEELATYLRFDVEAEAAEIAVEGACGLIRNATGKTFAHVANETILLDGSGTDSLVLPQVPVLAVTMVLADSEPVTDYKLYGSGILRRTEPCSTWREGRGTVEVTYSYGYLAENLPPEIRILALTVAARAYQQVIVTAQTTGMMQTTYATDALSFTAGEQNIISRHKVTRPDVAVVTAGS